MIIPVNLTDICFLLSCFSYVSIIELRPVDIHRIWNFSVCTVKCFECLGLLEAHANQQSPDKSPTKVWTYHRIEAKCAIRHIPSVDILFWTASNLIAWMQLFCSTLVSLWDWSLEYIQLSSLGIAIWAEIWRIYVFSTQHPRPWSKFCVITLLRCHGVYYSLALWTVVSKPDLGTPTDVCSSFTSPRMWTLHHTVLNGMADEIQHWAAQTKKMLLAYRVRGNIALQFNQLQTGSLKHRTLVLKNASNYPCPEFLLTSRRDQYVADL